MTKHIHIHFAPRSRSRDQAPGSVPTSRHNALVEALLPAIAARQGGTSDREVIAHFLARDVGFDESKVKHNEGGKFSAQQHQAKAAEHEAAAAKHDQEYKTSGSPAAAAARNAHQEAADLHKSAAGHVNAQTGWASHNAQKAHAASSAAETASAAAAGPASLADLKAQASNPKLSVEQRAQAVAQLDKMEKSANAVAASPYAVPEPGFAQSPKGEINQLTGQPISAKPASAATTATKAATPKLLATGLKSSKSDVVNNSPAGVQKAHALAESKYDAASKKMPADVKQRRELLSKVPPADLITNPYYHHAQAEKQARLDVFRKSLPGGKIPIPGGPSKPAPVNLQAGLGTKVGVMSGLGPAGAGEMAAHGKKK